MNEFGFDAIKVGGPESTIRPFRFSAALGRHDGNSGRHQEANEVVAIRQSAPMHLDRGDAFRQPTHNHATCTLSPNKNCSAGGTFDATLGTQRSSQLALTCRLPFLYRLPTYFQFSGYVV